MIFDQLAEIFSTYRVISAIISVVFLFVVIRYLIVTDALGGFRKYKLDIYKYGGEEKKRIPARWKRVLKLVQSSEPEDWKQAVLYADEMFDDMLKIANYGGATAVERLAGVDASQITTNDQLRELRSGVFSAINADEQLDQAHVKDLLREYRTVFQGMGYL